MCPPRRLSQQLDGPPVNWPPGVPLAPPRALCACSSRIAAAHILRVMSIVGATSRVLRAHSPADVVSPPGAEVGLSAVTSSSGLSTDLACGGCSSPSGGGCSAVVTLVLPSPWCLWCQLPGFRARETGLPAGLRVTRSCDLPSPGSAPNIGASGGAAEFATRSPLHRGTSLVARSCSLSSPL